jgi:phosphoribosylformylglycinamidine synthase PurS subunit
MLAKVYVTLKNGVLDPQGKAIHHAAETIGYQGIADVRQGKYFEISLDPSLDDAEARARIEKFAHEVLANPVIENYRVDIVRS